MGNHTLARGPDEAMDLFLNREFPEILDIKKGKSHNVTFIPDSFIYKGLTEKVRHILKGKKNKLHYWKNNHFLLMVNFIMTKCYKGILINNIDYFYQQKQTSDLLISVIT
jgi:hypothetical protein